MQLKKTITKDVLLLLAINAIIGTGIFFLPSVAAGISGPASIISWIVASVVAILISMYFAELVSLFPKSGGVYEYSKNAFGSMVGFLTGWTSWIVANVTIAMLIVGGLSYLSAIIPLTIVQRIILGLLFVLLVNIVNYKGVDLSVKLLLVFAVITVSILWLIITWGSFSVDISNFTPFFVFPNYSILIALFFVLETFFGWETVTFLTEETKNPRKTVPKVIVKATIIVSLLVLLLVVVSLGVAPWYSFAFSNAQTYSDYTEASSRGLLVEQESPLVYTASRVTKSPFIDIIAILILLNIFGTAAAWIIATPRLIFAISRDKLLPEPLSKIHKKNRTPHNAIILQTLLTSLIVLSGSFLYLLSVLLPLVIIMYSVVLLSVTCLHIRDKNLKPGYKSPFPKILPGIISFFLIYLMFANTEVKVLLVALAFILMGVPLYVTTILGYNKKIIRFFHELLAPIIFLFTKISIKKSVLGEMLAFVSTQEKIVEFGCGVGVATTILAKRYPIKKIYGLDFSKSELAIAKRIKKQKKLDNLEYYNTDVTEIEKNKELDKKIKKFDGTIIVALLGYLESPGSFLKSISERMEKGSKFFFVEYNYPSQIWNKQWIEHDQQIKQIFNYAGLDVVIERERFLFWEYVKMFGVKR